MAGCQCGKVCCYTLEKSCFNCLPIAFNSHTHSHTILWLCPAADFWCGWLYNKFCGVFNKLINMAGRRDRKMRGCVKEIRGKTKPHLAQFNWIYADIMMTRENDEHELNPYEIIVCTVCSIVVYAHSAIVCSLVSRCCCCCLFVIFACLFFFFFCSTLTVRSIVQNIILFTFLHSLRVEHAAYIEWENGWARSEWVSILWCAAELCIYVIHVVFRRYICCIFCVALNDVAVLNDRHTFEPHFFRHLCLVGIKLRTVSIVHL